VLSLLGVKDTGPWAWNGKMPELAKQIRKSLLTTMHGPEPAAEQVEAIEAFLRTLPPPPPLFRPTTAEEEAAVRRGREMFERQDCGRCHAPPSYTSAKAYSVGLVDEVGNTHFNPPSLRGVGQGGPYFHDNRAATLEEVFTRHRHQVQGKLSETELADMLAFLRSL
jgi:mono/diheme cytochrome c family protein